MVSLLRSHCKRGKRRVKNRDRDRHICHTRNGLMLTSGARMSVMKDSTYPSLVVTRKWTTCTPQ